MNNFKNGVGGLLLLDGSLNHGHNGVCIWVGYCVEVGYLVKCHATGEYKGIN